MDELTPMEQIRVVIGHELVAIILITLWFGLRWILVRYLNVLGPLAVTLRHDVADALGTLRRWIGGAIMWFVRKLRNPIPRARVVRRPRS